MRLLESGGRRSLDYLDLRAVSIMPSPYKLASAENDCAALTHSLEVLSLYWCIGHGDNPSCPILHRVLYFDILATNTKDSWLTRRSDMPRAEFL